MNITTAQNSQKAANKHQEQSNKLQELNKRGGRKNERITI